VERAPATRAVPGAAPPRREYADVPALTAGLRAGEDDAFRVLHAGWNARLFRYCFVLAGADGALAGEIAQAVYLRVARHMRPLPDSDALWSWLARAARSAASDFRRTGGRYRCALDRFAEWVGRPRDMASACEDDAEARALAALDRALAELPSEHRQLIELRYFAGQSLDEIAARLSLTARAAEGRLARLRAGLRESLARQLLHPDENA
jgi:RNA polymerase sigma-70 factor (ECF subfamily)